MPTAVTAFYFTLKDGLTITVVVSGNCCVQIGNEVCQYNSGVQSWTMTTPQILATAVLVNGRLTFQPVPEPAFQRSQVLDIGVRDVPVIPDGEYDPSIVCRGIYFGVTDGAVQTPDGWIRD